MQHILAMKKLIRLNNLIRRKVIFKIFTWVIRILLAAAFIPSGLKKLLGLRFTSLGTETEIGFFFEALYRSGWYWNFLGFMQLASAVLLIIPRTTTIGSLLYLPLAINIFCIVTSIGLSGTPIIAGLMVLGNVYLLFWDMPRMVALGEILTKKQKY